MTTTRGTATKASRFRRAMVGLGAGVLLCGGALVPASMAVASEADATSGGAVADGPQARGSSYVGGGYWEYGVSGGHVWSKYQHASRVHKATACAQSRCAHSGWRAPSYLAVASRPKASHGNTAFWDVG